ncbi:pyruvate [Striga asiatica]|uniref:Pyruvate n=1 Tax=Striga asiatica TaxID=4170 RepID=A0A5A7RFY1_STRAF|nr:pyruvate [Striga asiatica]
MVETPVKMSIEGQMNNDKQLIIVESAEVEKLTKQPLPIVSLAMASQPSSSTRRTWKRTAKSDGRLQRKDNPKPTKGKLNGQPLWRKKKNGDPIGVCQETGMTFSLLLRRNGAG